MKICRQHDPGYFTPVPDNRAACWLHHEAATKQLAAFKAARVPA